MNVNSILANINEAKDNYAASFSSGAEIAILTSVKAIRSNISQSYKLDELAEMAGMSLFHFIRRFSCITGVTPGKFINAVKLDYAKRHLFNTRETITSICFDLGYASLGSFTSTFTNWVGFTPSMYRRLARQVGEVECPPSLIQIKGVGSKKTQPAIAGCVLGVPAGSTVVIGAFRCNLPRGRPIRSTIICGGGPYILNDCPIGGYRIFAVADSLQAKQIKHLFHLSEQAFVAASVERVNISGKKKEFFQADLRLRALTELDPPIVFAYGLDLAMRISDQ